MESKCIIFGAGECYAPKIKISKSDIVIAADGGYAAAVKLGIEPQAIIGDFDSSAYPEGATAHIIKLDREKDDTDTLAAVKLGLRRGYKTFILYGGVGGRLDHTVANLQTLAYLNAFDARGYLVDRDSVATVMTDGKTVLPKSTRGTVSVFAFGGSASGVTLKNLKYPLDNATLEPSFPLGVSNEAITGKPPEISVKHGSLLIFFAR